MLEPTELARILVVEDSASLRSAIVGTVAKLGARILEAGTARRAIELLAEKPDLVIADVCLPDDSALSVFRATLRLRPEPLKIAISGQASAEQAFQLAQLGVREYLAKPFSLADLKAAIERVRTQPPELEPLVRSAVGKVAMREVTTHVREVMIDEALARSQGSHSGAARLLDVTRQAVQQITRRSQGDAARSGDDAVDPPPASGGARSQPGAGE